MANGADCDSPSLAAGPTLQAQDVVAGLGAAPRDLLATSLALFEDSTLLRRLGQLAAEYKGKWFDKTPATDRAQASGDGRIWAIVADGAVDVRVALELSGAAQALLGVDAGKIQVLKMEGDK